MPELPAVAALFTFSRGAHQLDELVPRCCAGLRVGVREVECDRAAGYHCQPMARELTEQRMFDWLDEHIYA